MSHINVTDIGTIVREEYTMHGLHLNFRGAMKLTHLSAESICGGQVASRNSSIPVITHATAFPILD
jgi:lipoate-protein ligase B